MKASLATQVEGSRKLGEVLDENKNKDGSPIVFSKETLKKHVDKVTAALERAHQANADVKSAYEQAEKAGIPAKELKGVVKIRTKRHSDDYKATVNIMLEMLGELPLFHFADMQKH